MNPSKPSLNYNLLASKRRLISDLWGGTEAMRARGTEYLPQWSNEAKEEYEFRLRLAYLPTQWKRNIAMLSGKPFAKPLVVTGGRREWVEALSRNCDGRGMPLEVFAKKCFTSAQRDGVVGIRVDAPQLGQGASLADAEANGGPFFEEIDCRRIIDAHFEYIAGHRKLTEIRITGWGTEADPDDPPFGIRYYPTVMVYRRGSPVTVTKYRAEHQSISSVTLNPYAVGISSDKWRAEETIELPKLTEIPFVFMFGPSEHEDWFCEPTYYDFAYVALQQYQSTADQRNILHVARVPILFGAGFDPQNKLVIAPLRFIGNTNPQARLGYVEVAGNGIAAGEKDLERLEMAIAMMGIEPLTRRPKYKTAAEDENDVMEQESPLQSSARMMAASLQQALAHAAVFSDSRISGVAKPDATSFKVEVFLEFGVSYRAAEELRALLEARKEGEITGKLLLTELRRRGVIAESVDIDAELAAAKAEKEADLDSEMARELELASRAMPQETPSDNPDDQGADGQ